MADKAAAQSTISSYVDGGGEDPKIQPDGQNDSEAKAQGSLGSALLMASFAAEFMLGFLIGLLAQMQTDKDYAAWRKLKQILEYILALEEVVKERYARIEIAKKQCMAGIRRAQNIGRKRPVPYYKVLAALLVFPFLPVSVSHAQTIERYDGILIDTSASINQHGRKGELFHEYLRSAKRLLATEPPNSQVFVSTIAKDSFGGPDLLLTGWTPDAHGVFADDLNRARRQLLTQFDRKSLGLAPTSCGTDIFGGLSRLKVLFESSSNLHQPNARKTIWIFSDMMNETPDFPMPQLLEAGPERMLERAKEGGLLVPLPHYQVRVFGASTTGLSARSWETTRRFWEMYFAAAGAQLVTYSAECDARR